MVFAYALIDKDQWNIQRFPREEVVLQPLEPDRNAAITGIGKKK